MTLPLSQLLRLPTLAILTIAAMLLSAPTLADETTDCLQKELLNGADDLTLGELRARCSAQKAPKDSDTPDSRLLKRLNAERSAAANPYSLLAHKPNYILLGAWNQRGWDSTLQQDAENNPLYMNDDVEVQFQLSFKVPLAIDLWEDRMDIYAAYTNRSFWQMYNQTNSQPFRETNHEPEIWAQFRNDWSPFGVTNVLNAVGFVHQSNGQSEPLSRGWNRVYANFIFEKEDFVFSIKPWVWVFKDSADGDNPDLDDYLGHGEIRASWAKEDHIFSTMIRNQLESGFERGAVELSWSFPVFNYPYLKGYVQYFYGYGESLIDYDQRVNRIGLGISVTDWLD